MTETVGQDVVIRREGRAGRITLNRPKALNALTYGMVQRIWEALLAWRQDPAVELVVLDGAGERGLCAGGDVVSLYQSRGEGSRLARTFWRDEYRLNALIGRYPKPYVAFMDGIVMGGGIGLSAHGRHRLVTERSQLAMPETGIGLIPDVGGTWLLSRAPGETGAYLGLTGEIMQAADALYAGFADALVPVAQWNALIERLCDPRGGGVAAAIATFATKADISELARRRRDIDAAFSGRTVEAILAALETGGDWARERASLLRTKSPKSMKLTLAGIRRARALPSLEEALKIEYRLTCRLFEDGEFLEGVRALLVDKDRRPKWRPDRLELVTEAIVEAFFAPLPAGEELSFESPDDRLS
jgi:enoyl-CoA hydratase